MPDSDNKTYTPAPELAPSPYNWPHLARLAARYGVDPQVMLDLLVAQGHRLLEHLGEAEVIRELLVAGMAAKAPVSPTINDMYDFAVRGPCDLVPGVQRIRERRAAQNSLNVEEFLELGEEQS